MKSMSRRSLVGLCLVLGIILGGLLGTGLGYVMFHNPHVGRVTASYQFLRLALELLYFLSGIVVAVGVLLGLRQLGITREIARTNAQREALKFAAERCQYFGETVVALLSRFNEEYKRLRLTFLGKQPPWQWKIKNGEIVEHNFDAQLIAREIPTIEVPIVAYLNALEGFAIPFAAGVADDDLGFKETAMGFCQVVRVFMPAFFHLRRINAARYESTIKLFDIWNKRLAAGPAAQAMKPLEELLRSVERERIRPLGTDG